jgi:hypothetical protein
MNLIICKVSKILKTFLILTSILLSNKLFFNLRIKSSNKIEKEFEKKGSN